MKLDYLDFIAYRLIKHTGYGNAAGLLMSRGLLQGGHSKGQEDYSSDDQDSDTEEYESSKPKLVHANIIMVS